MFSSFICPSVGCLQRKSSMASRSTLPWYMAVARDSSDDATVDAPVAMSVSASSSSVAPIAPDASRSYRIVLPALCLPDDARLPTESVRCVYDGLVSGEVQPVADGRRGR